MFSQERSYFRITIPESTDHAGVKAGKSSVNMVEKNLSNLLLSAAQSQKGV